VFGWRILGCMKGLCRVDACYLDGEVKIMVLFFRTHISWVG
jgi:hypothetical protein